jgi:hypothetical protein
MMTGRPYEVYDGNGQLALRTRDYDEAVAAARNAAESTPGGRTEVVDEWLGAVAYMTRYNPTTKRFWATARN